MATSMDLRAWVQSATGAEFARRIDAEPGLLDSCDSGGDRFGVLHHAAALGRLDLIQMILERGVASTRRAALQRSTATPKPSGLSSSPASLR